MKAAKDMNINLDDPVKKGDTVLRLGGRFNAAKPLLYEVPTYLAGCPIGTLNRKTKRKKSDGKKHLVQL